MDEKMTPKERIEIEELKDRLAKIKQDRFVLSKSN